MMEVLDIKLDSQVFSPYTIYPIPYTLYLQYVSQVMLVTDPFFNTVTTRKFL